MSKLEGHAILELMGHRRMAGKVEEVEVAGVGFIRVDIPDTEKRKGFTQLVSPKSIYAITPCDEETAAKAAKITTPEPYSHWELNPIPARAALVAVDEDPDDEDNYDDEETPY